MNIWKRIKKVDLGEGMEPVYIQALPAAVFVDREESKNLSPSDLVLQSIFEKDGTPLFASKSELLTTISLVDFNTILKAVLDLNGMVDAEKNSEGQTAK